MEHTLLLLKGVVLGFPHLGGILLIFGVINFPAIGSKDLINLLLHTVTFCHSNSLQLVLPEAGMVMVTHNSNRVTNKAS